MARATSTVASLALLLAPFTRAFGHSQDEPVCGRAPCGDLSSADADEMRVSMLQSRAAVPSSLSLSRRTLSPSEFGQGRQSPSSAYAIILDAGSSKTLCVVYRRSDYVKLGKVKGAALSTFHDAPCDAVPMIQDLLRGAQQHISDENEQKRTPVWLRATAGVRLLQPAETDSIIDCLNTNLSQPGATNFSWQNAMVASGNMEAVYGSIAANVGYVNGSTPEYVGTLEMGGASTQIAFMPAGQILNGEFIYHDTKMRPVHIYAKSYHRFGQVQGLYRSFDLLIHNALEGFDRTGVIEHPCLFKNFEVNYTTGGGTYMFRGTSDSDRCRDIARALMHSDYQCMLPPCAMMAIYQPEQSVFKKFHAVGAFYYAVKGLGLVKKRESRRVTPRNIAERLAEFCSQTIDELKQKGNIKYTKYLCFNGWFAHSILKSAHFEDDSDQITFVKGASWTLGALIFLTELDSMRAPAVV